MSQLKKKNMGAVIVSDQFSTCPKADLNKTVFTFLPKVAIDKVLDNWCRSDGSLFQTVGTTKEKARREKSNFIVCISDKRWNYHRTFVDCELLLWVGRRGWDNLVDLSLGSSLLTLPPCTRSYIGFEANVADEALVWCCRIFLSL